MSAREIIEYAYDLALIHQIIYNGESIECRYVSKAEVPASDYYDFGLYEIEGIPIVYTPIHYKDAVKTLAKEKVFIGNTRAQNLEIAGFVNDFDALWRTVQDACSDQKPNHLPISERSPENRHDNYYTNMHFLKPEFFEELYCKKIRSILLDELGADIPKIALFASSQDKDGK